MLHFVLVFVQLQGHHHFFKRRIARPFANSIHGALHDIYARFDASQGVCSSQA